MNLLPPAVVCLLRVQQPPPVAARRRLWQAPHGRGSMCAATSCWIVSAPIGVVSSWGHQHLHYLSDAGMRAAADAGKAHRMYHRNFTRGRFTCNGWWLKFQMVHRDGSKMVAGDVSWDGSWWVLIPLRGAWYRRGPGTFLRPVTDIVEPILAACSCDLNPSDVPCTSCSSSSTLSFHRGATALQHGSRMRFVEVMSMTGGPGAMPAVSI